MLDKQVVVGDITQQKVDVIVNAANTSLLGGGGVDGAIHRAAGPELLAECKTLGGCETGSAKLTRGYALAAKYILHAVGPVWRDGNHHEDVLLASCYQTCLNIADEKQLRSIAFPAISCGIYRFPLERAVEIAVKVVSEFKPKALRNVYFVCFSESIAMVYLKQLP